MSPFATKKTFKTSKVKTVLAWICLFMAFLMVLMVVKFAKEKDVASVVLWAVVGVAFVIPPIISSNASAARFTADNISSRLALVADREVSFEKLEKMMPSNNLIKDIKQLLKKGYLQNLKVDDEKKVVYLLAENTNLKKISVKCPFCGKISEAVEGQSAVCPSCGQVILRDEEEERLNRNKK